MSGKDQKKKKSQIRTLSDLSNGNTTGSRAGHPSAYHKPIAKQPGSNAAPAGPTTFQDFRVCAIPTLPNANEALAMIQRVAKEFEPIVHRRGYPVRSVSEMCCCFDGLDFNENGERSKRRRKRVMPSNVLGYNQTTSYGGNKSNTIHIRLRHPQSHDRLYLYEDVAGTMAHELAHCEIGPHNDAFNKLMDEILEEHMVLQCQKASFPGQGMALGASGQNGGSSFPGQGVGPFPGQGMALGGSAKSSILGSAGYKLGGNNIFSKFLSPKEAAAMAAEARRRQQKLRSRGQRCCQPCTITIPDNDDEEPIVEYHHEDKKRPAVPITKPKAQQKRSKTNTAQQKKSKTNTSAASKPIVDDKGVIDLTEDDDIAIPSKAASKRASGGVSPLSSEEEEWPCTRCTFVNPPMALVCSMCSLQKNPM